MNNVTQGTCFLTDCPKPRDTLVIKEVMSYRRISGLLLQIKPKSVIV